MPFAYDPEIAAAAQAAPRLDLRDILGARQMLSDLWADLPPFEPGNDVTWVVREAGGVDDAPAVELHVLRPANLAGTPAPALLWFHGGGFVLGDAQDSLPFLLDVTRRTGAVTISIQQRLAPEAPYPAAINDGYAALHWLHEHHGELCVDPSRIAVGGTSAGAAQAAGLALRARDANGPSIAFQLLDIPVLDDQELTTSACDYIDTVVWNRSNAEAGWRAYLRGTQEPIPPYAAPARATDLQSLPPTFITANQFDPLRDEAIEFARRLAHANVPTELHLYAGTFHASHGFAPDAAVSQRQNLDLISALARAFGLRTRNGEGEPTC